jgi:hypothetical protein
MSTDANGYARANGSEALRKVIDAAAPVAAPGWRFLTEHKVACTGDAH